jgi:cytoskeletal protein RodZ
VGTLTLGERLVKLRSEKRITLSEASRGTKIQMKYLDSLENGKYGKLPADVYVKGFLRSYGQYLGVDENYLIKLYERERDIHKNINREETEKNFFKPVKFSSVIVNPKLLLIVFIVFFVGLGFFYLYRELKIFISNPRLVVTSSGDNFSTEEKTVKIEGVTEKDSKLLINNQSVIVSEDGKFSEEVVLQNGINNIAIKAINRFDKTSEKLITVEAKFETVENKNDSEENEISAKEPEIKEMKIEAQIFIDTKPVLVTVKADDEVVFREIMAVGATKIIEAKNKISVSAEKGKYVSLSINGKNLGQLSKDTKPVFDRIFLAEKFPIQINY